MERVNNKNNVNEHHNNLIELIWFIYYITRKIVLEIDKLSRYINTFIMMKPKRRSIN